VKGTGVWSSFELKREPKDDDEAAPAGDGQKPSSPRR
jgi:hypothetical protein